jgi:anti-sigma B factor antagonist
MGQTQIQVQQLPKGAVVHIDGAIEVNNFPGLAHVLNQLLLSPGPRVVLECSRVSYVGTAELKALLDFAHIARARGGDVKCAGLAPTIEQVATLIANGDPLECFATVVDALAGFRFVPAPA